MSEEQLLARWLSQMPARWFVRQPDGEVALVIPPGAKIPSPPSPDEPYV